MYAIFKCLYTQRFQHIKSKRMERIWYAKSKEEQASVVVLKLTKYISARRSTRGKGRHIIVVLKFLK